MKTKLNFQLIIIGFVLIFTNSCEKDDTGTPFKRVSKIIISDDPTQTLEYNSDGKLSKRTLENYWYYTYTYSGNTIIIKSSSLNNGYSSSDTLILNSQGYVQKKIDSWSTTTYEYDNEGYCTKKIFVPVQGAGTTHIETYTYVNGNRVTAGVTHIYEYYLDKENTLSDEHFGITFYGKSNKNLVKQVHYSGGSTDTYTYEFDQDNYVTKETETRSGGLNETSWMMYIYE